MSRLSLRLAFAMSFPNVLLQLSRSVSVSLCLCQTNLHTRVALQAPPNETTLQSQPSDRRKQNASISAVH